MNLSQWGALVSIVNKLLTTTVDESVLEQIVNASMMLILDKALILSR